MLSISLGRINAPVTNATLLADLNNGQGVTISDDEENADLMFVARDGRVVNIRERAVPMSEETISSDGPVRAVLELNGGTVSRLGIRPGDRLRHAMFGNAG